MKYRLFLLFLLVFSFSVKAQIKLDFKHVDKKTYAFYQEAKWDSLVKLGKQARKEGIDYYYLNYRMGIAHFYEGNYRQSIYYFQQALKQNSEALKDDYFVELLHLSYVYSQRADLAMAIALPSTSETLDPLSRGHFGLLIGGGSLGDFDKLNGQKPQGATYSEMHYQEAVSYWNLNFRYQFSANFSLGLAYTKLNFSNVGAFDINDTLVFRTYSISQYNFSIIPEFSLGTQWQIRPVFAFSLSQGYPSIIDTINGNKVFNYWNYKERNAMLGVNLYRHIRNVKLGLNIGVSNYSQQAQIQTGINVTYYPFGNLNVYTYTSASIKMDDGNQDFVFQQEIGFRTFSKLWVELGGTFGNMKNYSVYNLGYGYNIPDNMDLLVFSKLILILQNIDIFIKGQYAQKYTLRKDDFVDDRKVETRINYDQWSIEGGIIWNF